jgi:hypothetical protein
MCGESSHGVDDFHVVGLVHVLEHLRSMPDVPVVRPGFAAERNEAGAPWSVTSVGA